MNAPAGNVGTGPKHRIDRTSCRISIRELWTANSIPVPDSAIVRLAPAKSDRSAHDAGQSRDEMLIAGVE